jgi:hypothetical protein
MTKRRATCACENLVVTCEGEPVRLSMCHCFSCQKRTGSVFGVQARFPNDKVTIEGRSATYVRIGDSGGRIEHRFCPTCGATVTWTIDTMPGVTAVAVGAFADPSFPPPRIAVYEDRAHPWAKMPDLAIERHE